MGKRSKPTPLPSSDAAAMAIGACVAILMRHGPPGGGTEPEALGAIEQFRANLAAEGYPPAILGALSAFVEGYAGISESHDH
jgi:hypothetical protein